MITTDTCSKHSTTGGHITNEVTDKYTLWPLQLPPHRRKPHIPKLVGKRLKTHEFLHLSTALSPPQMDKAEPFQWSKASTALLENMESPCFEQGDQGSVPPEAFSLRKILPMLAGPFQWTKGIVPLERFC